MQRTVPQRFQRPVGQAGERPGDRQFWAEVFGMVTDRFGTPWLVNGPMLKM